MVAARYSTDLEGGALASRALGDRVPLAAPDRVEQSAAGHRASDARPQHSRPAAARRRSGVTRPRGPPQTEVRLPVRRGALSSGSVGPAITGSERCSTSGDPDWARSPPSYPVQIDEPHSIRQGWRRCHRRAPTAPTRRHRELPPQQRQSLRRVHRSSRRS